MINKKTLVIYVFVFMIMGLITQKPAQSQSQVVAVHSKLTQDSISQQTLRAIFAMRHNKWPDGTPIRVFVLSTKNSEHRKFCKDVLNMFPYQLQRTWDRLIYSGTGQAPLQVKNIAEMKEKISTTPGAIGYLPEESVDEQTLILEVN